MYHQKGHKPNECSKKRNQGKQENKSNENGNVNRRFKGYCHHYEREGHKDSFVGIKKKMYPKHQVFPMEREMMAQKKDESNI